MLRFLCPGIDILCKVRREDRIALRHLKNMVPDSQFFRLLRSQNIIILFHQLSDRGNTRPGQESFLRPVQLDLRTEQEVFHCFSVREALAQIYISNA